MSTIVNFHTSDSANSTPDNNDWQTLTQLLAKYAPHDGGFDIADNAIHIVRSSQPHEELTYMLSQPSICIIAQGAKRVMLAKESFEYDQSKMVVYAAEVPIHVMITQASVALPHFCLVIPINPKALNRLVQTVFADGVPKMEKMRAVYIGDTTANIVNAARRLMEIVAQQQDTDLLVPHTIDEILLRLLRSSAGPAIAQLGLSGSHVEKIANAISWIKGHYTHTIKVDALAKQVGMSTSSFHTHFKEVTQLSPLQFQKILRLQEARHLIRGGIMDVTHVAYQVGYTSASQFSREYTREFGIAPSKDSC